ncbi:hypothetical protein MPER_05030 [Moniliophthora perniciosa FA553]|nr:hypothetical protein MPER_05030 [Moniliophthora perniciosa FA553]
MVDFILDVFHPERRLLTVLSAALLDPKSYPSLDVKPPMDSPEVQQWKQEVADSGIPIPDIPPTVAGKWLIFSGCPANPDAVKDTSRCWWTCGGCTQPSDISDCPTKNHWGLTCMYSEVLQPRK